MFGLIDIVSVYFGTKLRVNFYLAFQFWGVVYGLLKEQGKPTYMLSDFFLVSLSFRFLAYRKYPEDNMSNEES